MIYLDVTETVLWWAWSPTGIQRVVLSLVSATRNRTDVVPILRFSDLSGRFCGWRRLIPDHLESILSFDTKALKPIRFDGLRRAVVQVGNVFANRVINGIAPAQVWRWKEVRRLLLGENRFTARSQEAFKCSERIEFHNGDSLVVVDSQWNSPDSWYQIADVRAEYPGLRIISLIYDITPIVHPHLFAPSEIKRFDDYLLETSHHSDGIIAISKASLESYHNYQLSRKMDVSRYSPFTTIRLGDELVAPADNGSQISIDQITASDKELNQRLSESTRNASSWLLWVGSLHPKKNLEVVLMAMKRLWHDDRLDMPLIVAGKEHPYSQRLAYTLRSDPALNSRLVFLGDVSDITLAALYRQAHCLIQSSWSEGYGLTVAEALQYGCPCVVSRVESLPEVGGDLVDYFDPWRPDQLTDQILRLVKEPIHYERRKKDALRFVPTTWSRTLEDLVAAISAKAEGDAVLPQAYL